ncbi:hypothetical protein [Wolbachia endosymbiont (group A) of Bombylius major]|uniref:hypothetical protein n=1 Tax=Wolbachia endosymbiont (group A) of Bombylius major TaxID=2953988 RepID=UPI002232CB15|nr:hypothetical protein [Wolbachia endosymbiont (group A) of Bombylius major]
MLASLTLGVRSLFTSSEPSTTYVKDLRKVMMYDGRKCQYPKNYDQIVQSAKIIENRDMHGNAILDKDKNPTYKLLYGQKDENGEQPSFRLSLVTKDEDNDRSYFTINYIDNQGKQIPTDSLNKSYFEPLGFSRMDLKKHVPIFEAEKTKDPQYPFELTNSSVLTKEVKNKEGKVQEVVDEKGRNGELLYTSDYKKLSTHFSEIRDQNGNLELDKSLISVPIVFATSLAKVCTKLLTSLPMKLGEYLIGKQNPIAKSFGYLLFTPAMAVKNLVDMGATILKAPVLLFVADKKKYGDAYFTMWKHQLKECWEEAKSDFNVIKGEERLKPDHRNRKSLVGTWDELNARRPDIERDLEKALNKSSESIDKSREPGVGKSLKNESIAESGKKAIAQEKLSNHADKITQKRQVGASAPSYERQ